MSKHTKVPQNPVKIRDRFVAGLLLVTLFTLPPAAANPQGGQVRQGQARITVSPGQVRIHQQSQRAVIDWQSFSIKPGETTRFIQPNATAAALNRVRGDSASRIEGLLRANGRVYLINPNGILVGPGGRIDVGGFVASTLDTSDAAFMRGGNLRFSGNSDAAIVNLGSISALDGDVVLMAGSVSNAGSIRAPRGNAALAAGNDILLSESGEERVFVRGSGGTAKATGVSNTGSIEANIAELKAHGGNIYGIAVKNEGRVAATGVTRRGGQIFLSAGGGGKVRSTGTLKAKAKSGSGGRIRVDAGATGRAEVGGIVDASSMTGAGGEITVLGNDIELFEGTLVLNDGANAGGTTRIGGGLRGLDPDFNNSETVRIGNGANLSANATSSGKGGEVIVFSKGSLTFDGHLSVAGASGGPGGFAELSGQREVFIRNLGAQVNLGAATGPAGTLLIDPIDISITPGANNDIVAGTSITDGSISHFLNNTGNLIITTSSVSEDFGDITLAANSLITWDTANSLTLLADRDILFTGDSQIRSTGGGAFSALALRRIDVGVGAIITTVDGDLTLEANQQTVVTPGDFTGITIAGGTVGSTGSGNVTLSGRGGDGFANRGISIDSGASVHGGTSGLLKISGRGGSGPVAFQNGILVSGTTTLIDTNGADVEIEGFGSGTGAVESSYGIFITGGATVGSGGSGSLTLYGKGGDGENYNNVGIYVASPVPGVSTMVRTSGGDLSITGVGGGTGSSLGDDGVRLWSGNGVTMISSNGGAITIEGVGGPYSSGNYGINTSANISSGGGDITLATDRLRIGSDHFGSAVNSGSGTTTLLALSEDFAIHLGTDNTPGTALGITNTELSRISAGLVEVGSSGGGPVTVTGAINSTNHLALASNYGVTFNQSVTMATNRNFSASATGTVGFSGTGSVAASGTGSVTLSAGRNISFESESGITVADGDVSLEANLDGTAIGTFAGIDLDNALIQSLGSGDIMLHGHGGNIGHQQYGVALRNGADILGGTSGLVSITGFGGNSIGTDHHGILLSGSGTAITSSGADVELTGTGGSGSVSSGIAITGASVTAGDTGTLTLHGTGGTANGGAFLHGIYLYEAFLNTAAGDVNVTGFGGSGSSPAGDYTGVHLDYTTISSGGTGTVTVSGTAGTAVLSQTLIGVDVRFDSRIDSSGGDVIVTGFGGATTNPGVSNGSGVRLIADGTITAGGTGAVSVTGTGGEGMSIGHEGIVINGSGFEGNLARIGAANGETTVTAIAGNEASHALVVGINHAGRITSGTDNAITIHADSISVGSAGVISSGSGNTTVLTRTAGTRINLGGDDVLGGSPLTLGLTGAELDRFTAGTLLIGDNSSGTITLSQAITHSNNLSLLTGQGIVFNDDLTMATDRDLMLGAVGAILFSSNGSITSSGTGDVAIDGGLGVRLESNASINTVDGTVFVYGNADGSGVGQFEGIFIGNGASINTGSGQIYLEGRGGDGSSGGNHGIHLDDTSVIGSQQGQIEITGFGRGAAGAGSTQEGVLMKGSVSTGQNGTITIAGTGGNAASGNIGVNLFTNASVTTEDGALSITGIAGGGVGSPGLQIADFGDSSVTIGSNTGNISLIGESDSALEPGILAFGSGVSIGGGTGSLSLMSGGTTRFFGGASIQTLGNGSITLTSDRDIRIEVGSWINSVDGDILLSANQQTEFDIDDFIAIGLGGGLNAEGLGKIELRGQGGSGGVRISNSGSLTTNGGELKVTGTALDGDSIGIKIESGSLGASTGQLLLIGKGSGTGNAVESGLLGQVGSGVNSVRIESTGGGVQMNGLILADRLTLYDRTGTSSVDFALGNGGNRTNGIRAYGNGPLGAVGSLFYRDAYDFEAIDISESGQSILARGDVTLLSVSGSISQSAGIESNGGDILIEGDYLNLGADITTSGTGNISATSKRGLSVFFANIEAEEGDITLTANAAPTANSGSFIGLSLFETSLGTGGAGNITLRGNGGLDYGYGYGYGDGYGDEGEGPSPGSVGVLISDAVSIGTLGTGAIQIVGNGGDQIDRSLGIWIGGPDISISTAGGNLDLTGVGGGMSNGVENRGILINDALLSAGGTGRLMLHGTGGLGIDQIDGVQIGSNATLQVNNGALSITGIAGGTLGIGVMATAQAGDIRVLGSSNAASITITGTGSGAAGVSLGNSSAVLGSLAPISANVEVLSLGGDILMNRIVRTDGSVLLRGTDDIEINALLTGGTGGVELDGSDLVVRSLVTATGSDLTLRFGRIPTSGRATVNVLPVSASTRYIGRGPSDTLDLSGLANPSTIAENQLDAVENVIGNALEGSSVTGAATSNTFTIFGPASFSSSSTNFTFFGDLIGGDGDDLFLFTGNGSITGAIVGGGGNNRIDYSGYASAVTVNLATSTASGVGTTYSGISEFTGSAQSDLVTGPAEATRYDFTGPSRFNTGTFSLISFENLNAGPLADRFVILPGGSLAGVLDGGGLPGSAFDILDHSLHGSEVQVNLGSVPLATATGLPGGFRGIESFIGSSASTDRFFGGNLAAIYRLTAANTFDSTNLLATGFENLTGGSASDAFLMLPGGTLGGILTGGDGSGIDTLSYALFNRAASVIIGPNQGTGLGGFAGIERIIGSRFNDNFLFLNQATVSLVDGGAGNDTVVIDDRDLDGSHVYNITAGGVSRNPSYPIANVETLQLVLGNGGNTINTGFFRFAQILNAGDGADSLNIPGVTSLNGGNQIGNIRHSGFESPRPLDTGDILKQEVDSTDQPQQIGNGNQIDNRNTTFTPSVLASQIGALGGAFSAAIVSQAAIIAVEGNTYLIFNPISLDGSGLTPSNLALGALQESLGVDANLELAAAIGYTGPIFLFNPDGAYALDLSGAPIDPGLLAMLQGNFTLEAISELSQALGLNVSVTVNLNDGVVALSLDGGVPGQQVALVLASQLDAAALAELNAALGL